MFAPKVTLTREDFYEKVWSTPMQNLAAEFGFSDVRFAKPRTLRRARLVMCCAARAASGGWTA